MERILILDDEPDMVENCQRILSRAGYYCITTSEPREAIALLDMQRPDLLLTDLRMPEVSGFDLLRHAHEIDPTLPVIMITAYASIESAVSAVREGAFDYIEKPFSIDQLRMAVERAMAQRRLALENLHLREQLQGVYGFENIVGRSLALQQVLELVRKAARSSANILILGESGTGKELVARAIHANSSRASKPFVPVDCASLPENLLETELFGYEKGAFTGATGTKQGLLETAHGGTVFLDEIGEIPPGLQAKLLRALQERKIRRVGGTREIDVDVRVVSATNRNLPARVADGLFREDLYYRINVIDVPLPPLRERAGDVTLLAQTFLKKYQKSAAREVHGFAAEALAALEAYPWPGNVRELQNIVERACALAENDLISLEDLPSQVRAPQPLRQNGHPQAPPGTTTLTLKEAKERWISQLEASYVSEVLKREGGNISQAARTAGVDRKTLHRLLNKHSIRG